MLNSPMLILDKKITSQPDTAYARPALEPSGREQSMLIPDKKITVQPDTACVRPELKSNNPKSLKKELDVFISASKKESGSSIKKFFNMLLKNCKKIN